MNDLLLYRPFQQLRSTKAYDFATRVFGGSWFLILALLMASAVIHQTDTLAIVVKSCLAIFYLILCLLLLVRSRPRSVARGFLPRLAAFAGTYMPWTIGFFPASNSVPLNLASAVCLIIGMVLAIITVAHLGKAFSVVPQAHKVVRSGPYRWLRHPLYASEEIAVFGTLLLFLSPITLAIFITHIGVQVCRIVNEEKLLRHTFPEYAMMTNWRLVPLVW